MHIAIAGNIGSGKTTLAQLLAKNFKWKAVFENIENNPYMNSFYNDMQRWAFNLQIYFLNTRLKQIIEIQNSKKTVIQDRTIYEDGHIFAPNLHSMGLMSTRDYENYKGLFEQINALLKPLDLLIYLRASVPTLVQQIQKRGRDYENAIRIDYLTCLNERYEAWISTYKDKLLIVDVDEIKFPDKPEHLGIVIDKINAELHGLF